jgi:hypothetical protein
VSALVASAVYRVEGQCAHASPYAAGPWNPTLQHGAAPAALVARAAERIPSEAPMTVARLTLDFVRPVPIAPLDIRTELVRQGRKIQLAAITLLAKRVEVVRASVFKVRVVEPDLPNQAREPALDLPRPELAHEASGPSRTRSAFLDGVSIRLTKEPVRRPGPASIWFRVDRPIVEDEPISPLMRAVITADFCNGASAVLDPGQWTFINGDLSLSLTRMPAGEWILLDAETWLGPDGGGIAFARMADTNGYFGRAVQSLLIERR